PSGVVIFDVPEVVRLPQIKRSANPVVGTKLGSYVGQWTDTPSSFSRQWIRCDADGTSNCTDIPGKTGTTYIPVLVDAGHTLRFRVIAHGAAGDSLPATSAPSGVIT